MNKKEKSRGTKYDGKSRVSTDLYRKNYDEIFKKGVVGKEVKVKDVHAWFKTMDCGPRHLDEQEKTKEELEKEKILKEIADRNGF